jgi:hypothetical protein
MDTPSNKIAIPETGYTTTIKPFTNKVGFTDSPYIVYFADGYANSLLKLDSLENLLKHCKGRGNYGVYALVKQGEGDIGEEYGKTLEELGRVSKF